MPDTDVFSWPMPTPGGSSGTWGTELNDLVDDHIEATVNAVKTTADAAMPRSGGVFTGEIEIQTERMATVNRGSMTGTITFNFDAASFQFGTITGTTTFAFTGWAPTGKAEFAVLEITNGSAHTITWPAAVRWDNGELPTLRASGVDVIILYTRDSGTTIRASHVMSTES